MNLWVNKDTFDVNEKKKCVCVWKRERGGKKEGKRERRG